MSERTRLRYPLIVNYASQVYRMLVAIGFSVIVIRRLKPDEYGLWVTALGVYGALLAVPRLWNLWATRQYARERSREAVGTALYLELLYTPVVATTMVAIGFFFATRVGADPSFFLLIALLMAPIDLLLIFYRGMLGVVKPEVIGYSSMIYETLRLPLAYVLIAWLGLGLQGLVLVVALSSLVSLGYLAMASTKLKLPLGVGAARNLLVKWFKASYVPVLSVVAGASSSLDRPLLSILAGSTQPTAYLGVVNTPKSLLMRSSASAGLSVYARALRGLSRQEVEEGVRILLLLNLGLASVLVAFSRPILSLYNPVYVDGWPLLVITSVESLFLSVWGYFRLVSEGADRSDYHPDDEDAFYRGPLLVLPGLYLIRSVVVLVTASASVMALAAWGGGPPVVLAYPFVIGWFVTSIPLALAAAKHAARYVGFSLPTKELLSFILAFSSVLLYSLLLGGWGIEVRRFWEDAPGLLLHVLVSLAIYCATALALSDWFRRFTKASLLYLVKELRHVTRPRVN